MKPRDAQNVQSRSANTSAFMQIIPGYEVILDPDDEVKRRVFRVGEDKLSLFVSALIASGEGDIRIIREELNQVQRH